MDRAQLLKLARQQGFKGATLDELKAWADETNTEFVGAKGAIDIDKVWNTKARLVLEAGETLNELSVEQSEASEGEGETLEDDMDDEEDAAKTRSLRERQKSGAARLREVNGKAHDAEQGKYRLGAKAAMSPDGMKRMSARKAYDRAVSSGDMIRVPGMGDRKTAFSDSEVAEHFLSSARLQAMGWRDYAEKSWDRQVVGKATNVTYDNDLGGNWVADAWSSELIELKNDYSAVRTGGGTYGMSEAVEYVSRFGDDVSVGDIAEDSSLPTSNITTGRVQLTARTSGCIAKVSNNLLQDSRVNVADAIARSIARNAGRFEDTLCFDGSITVGSNTYTREGIQGKIDSDSEFDAAFSSAWSEITVDDVTNWMGKLPAWAYELGTPKIYGSLPAYHQMLRKLTASAGGVNGAELATGSVPRLMYDGFEFVVTSVLPQSYTANDKAMYFGVLGVCTKLGDYGGMEIKTSEDRYFDENNFAIRGIWRWAWNPHDVGGGTDDDGASKSGIISFKV